jgi:hypothetical protein
MITVFHWLGARIVRAGLLAPEKPCADDAKKLGAAPERLGSGARSTDRNRDATCAAAAQPDAA